MRIARPSLGSLTVLAVVTASLAGCQAHLSNGDCDSRYSLLSEGRRCNPEQIATKHEYEDFEVLLAGKINEWEKDGSMTTVAVYFRDLENGPWFGIDENMEFFPASLMKTPVMMATLKLSETQPGLLDRELVYDMDPATTDNNANPGERLEVGGTYTVYEVLRRMMSYSDNRSAQLLMRFLLEEGNGRNLALDALDDLGVIDIETAEDAQLTVKQYATLFRQLYNSSYLKHDTSQQAMRLLAESEFVSGLVAGVPRGTVVAHKFGIWDSAETGKQLHDCGIVFHPQTPYLLCVMTRGTKDFHANADVISTISEMVYDEVANRATPLE